MRDLKTEFRKFFFPLAALMQLGALSGAGGGFREGGGNWQVLDRRYIQRETSQASCTRPGSHFRDEWSFSTCGLEPGGDGYHSLTRQRKDSVTNPCHVVLFIFTSTLEQHE